MNDGLETAGASRKDTTGLTDQLYYHREATTGPYMIGQYVYRIGSKSEGRISVTQQRPLATCDSPYR